MFYEFTQQENVRLMYHPSLSLIYNTSIRDRVISNFFRGYYQKHRDEHYGPIWEKRQIYFRNLAKIPDDKRYIIMIFPSVFQDRFAFEIVGDQLKIRREDLSDGWGQNLKIRVIDDKNHTHTDFQVGPSLLNVKNISLS
jgi:hypothetical protein